MQSNSQWRGGNGKRWEGIKSKDIIPSQSIDMRGAT